MLDVVPPLMRNIIITISFLFTCAASFAQRKNITVDSFITVNGYNAFYLLICSDSSFFVASSNCTESKISKGKWLKRNGNLILYPEVKELCRVKITAVNEVNKIDSLITFKTLDYLSNPISKYTLFFYDKDMKQYEYFTNDDGIIKIAKDKFLGYIPIDEYNNLGLGSSLNDFMHILGNKNSTITLTLNYPDNILRQRINFAPFSYLGDEFKISTKGLRSIKSKLVLKKL